MRHIAIAIAPVLMALGLVSNQGLGGVVDKEGSDVRLLGAGLTSRVVKIVASPAAVDEVAVASCQELRRTPRYSHGVHIFDYVDLDCTYQVERLLGTHVLGAVTVMAHMQPGTSNSMDTDAIYAGQVVELLTLSRRAALDYATVVGMYLSSSGIQWVSRGDLVKVVDAETRGGEAGVIHKFTTLFSG